MVKLVIDVENKYHRDRLMRAMKYLLKAGIEFDSAYSLGTNKMEWFFDWSLKGAKIED